MTYSQKPLLDLLTAGKIADESATPRRIETVISNIYLFGERAYKVYKNDNDFFNNSFHDLSARRDRFSFSKADFEWNQQLAKEVYLSLQGVKVSENGIQFVDEKDAEELLFVTKQLPAGTMLFDHLQKADLTLEDYHEIGRQFAEREKGFVWHGPMSDESLSANMRERYDDIIAWIKDVVEVTDEEKELWFAELKKLIAHVYTNDASTVSICFDFHSLNAFYVDHVLYPFDTHPPKDEWRFGPPLLNVYRLATDVYALAGEKEFNSLIDGYHEYLGKERPSAETNRLLVIYSALIMVSYLYMLGKTDTDKQSAAIKYHKFLKEYATT